MTSSALRTGTAGADAGRHTVWLGLGSNVGDRALNLARALDAVAADVAIDAVSDIYETEPFGYTAQPLFLNLVLRGRTSHDPPALLERLQQCERAVGRVPTFRMGPRVIDIDILLYDGMQMQTPALTLPHPGLLERTFVLLPLLDIEPGLVHPVTGVALAAAAGALDPAGVRRLGNAAELLPRGGRGQP
jgi:2-amino-4-hydroxy-6-hydroxymethyldihydropteridine diphosphokinase